MRSLDESLPLTLLRAREAVMDHFRPHLHNHGVTEQQWRVLRALAEHGALDAGTLAARVCLLMPSLSRILRDLSASGLLNRSRKSGDGRIVMASLTARGRSLFQKMSQESEQIYAAFAAEIGPERFATLATELEALIETMKSLPVRFQDNDKPARAVNRGAPAAPA